MRIVHVTRQFHPSVGGIESAIWHLSQHQRAAGHQVNVVTLNRLFTGERDCLQSQEVVDGIKVERIPFWGPQRYALAPSVLRYVRDCDLIHLHSSDFFLDYLAWAKLIHQKPIVFSSHGLYFHTPFASGLKKLYFRAITRLDLHQVSAVVCDSPHDLEMLEQVAPRGKLHLIPNGIDYDNLSRLDSTARDPNLLISVGRLHTNKRCDLLLRAFAHVLEQQPSARLALIGPDWGTMGSLHELSAELGIAGQVDIAGQVPADQLLDYLGRANLWLSASSYEGFGIALLEAMAAGSIPVVQPIPSFQQLLVENQEGFFTDFAHSSKAADAILKCMDLPGPERQRIGTLAREKASLFSWDRIAEQFESVYSQFAPAGAEV